MNQNLYRKLKITEIAKHISVSEKHFSRVFKEKYGVSPQKYMITMRIEAAKKLLCETELLIGAVAASVGYVSQLEFSKIFRLYVGMSAHDFRLKNRIAESKYHSGSM